MKPITIVAGVVVLGVMVAGILLSGRLLQSEPQEVAKVSDDVHCQFRSPDNFATVGIFASSTEACEAWKDQLIKKEILKIEKANALCGVASWQMSNGYELGCFITARMFQWEKEEWVETDDSKACAKYLMRPVSELPVMCLDYYDINHYE